MGKVREGGRVRTAAMAMEDGAHQAQRAHQAHKAPDLMLKPLRTLPPPSCNPLQAQVMAVAVAVVAMAVVAVAVVAKATLLPL